MLPNEIIPQATLVRIEKLKSEINIINELLSVTLPVNPDETVQDPVNW